jgi:non-specific serine/threonine protein kinase
LRRLEGEHDNLRSALAWCTEQGHGEVGLRLGTALSEFWDVRGYLTEGRERLMKLLSLPGAEARTSRRGRALYAAGILNWRQADFQVARALFEESLVIGWELGDHRGIADSLQLLGHVAREQGDYEEARALYEESLTIFRELGHHRGIAHALGGLGRLAREAGEFTRCAAHYRESMLLRQSDNEPAGILQSLEDFAGLAVRQGQWERAARLLGAAECVAQTLGGRNPVVSAKEYQRAVDGVRSALGEAGFAAAWAAGGAMTLQDAIRFALEEPGAGG